MKKFILPFVELMVIRTCNLSCQGCTTFSDLPYQGYYTWQQGKEWLEPWTDRLDIQAVGVMGGEPLINPEIEQWVRGIRQLLPNAQIRFVTNGLLLEKHWHIVKLLYNLGNSVIKISHHVEDPRLESVIKKIFSTWHWDPIEEFGIKRWASGDNCRFQINYPDRFLKTFQNDYANMMPHNNLPADAFKVCVQQRCPLIINGKLFKCGTVGLTPELLDRYNRPNWDSWQKYIDSGLEPNCNQAVLNDFISNFGKPHRLCAQCPNQSDIDSFIDHRFSVAFK